MLIKSMFSSFKGEKETLLIPKGHIYIWLIAAFLSFLISDELAIQKYILPIIMVSFFALLISKYHVRYIEYFLFFSISVTSVFGLTETLTGSHAQSKNAFLFGLSFYSASMAYLIAKRNFSYKKIFAISNPLLLITGPILLFFKKISHKKLKKRYEYYLPFMLVGIFMFQIVASPLTEFFFLIDKTDLISVIIFAVIFELFVYMNFCGLSLFVYGFFGLLGYKIPLNFKQPFSSRNIVEFWRGWHTTLSQVLKTLFYNPLRARFSIFYALTGVFIASAMWHGVTFNFVLWGIFHTLFFWLSVKILKYNYSLLPILMLPFIIVVGRIIFADSNTSRLLEKLTFTFEGFNGFSLLFNSSPISLLALFFGFLIIAIEFLFKDYKIMKRRNYKFLRTPFALLILCLLGVLFISNTGVDYAVYGQR